MIGLRRHRVELAEHDPEWRTLAVEACQSVRAAAGELLTDVQHVGSTAVPDLRAKPILDVAATIATLDDLPELIERLTAAGFRYRGNQGAEGGHYFIVDSAPDVRMLHLHVVEQGDPQWRAYLRFRDILREQPAIRQQYGELKQELARRFPTDREAYTAAKAAFIRDTLREDPFYFAKTPKP